MKKLIVALAAMLLMTVSCEKQKVVNTYFRVAEGAEDLVVSASEKFVDYAVYSDYERWKFVVTCEDGGDWVLVSLRDCEFDCKFKVKICENKSVISRTAHIDLVQEKSGKVIKVINILQEGK